MVDGDEPRTMKTVEASWDVVDGLEALDGAGVTELARYLDMSKATVYTHLATLRKRRYVVKRNGSYHLSLHFLRLGKYVKNTNLLFNAGREEVRRFADETGEYVHLVTEEHGELIYLHEAKGEHAVGEQYFEKKFVEPGYFHTSAYGKAILAHLSESRVDRIIETSGLPRRTANTITTREGLANELATIRDRGYAINDEEEVRGARAIGAPIFDRKDAVLGAISLTKPTSRMPPSGFDDAIAEAVTSTANAIEVHVQAIRSGTHE